MKCRCKNSNTKKKKISENIFIDGNVFRIDGLDADVCEECGEVYIKLADLVKAEKKIRTGLRKKLPAQVL